MLHYGEIARFDNASGEACAGVSLVDDGIEVRFAVHPAIDNIFRCFKVALVEVLAGIANNAIVKHIARALLACAGIFVVIVVVCDHFLALVRSGCRKSRIDGERWDTVLSADFVDLT